MQVAVPVPLPQLFDYLPPAGEAPPAVGSRVLVPFGRRRLVGLVVSQDPASLEGALKPIEDVLDQGLLTPELVELARWCARYYLFPPGELVNLLLPTALRRSQPFRPAAPEAWRLTAAGLQADLERAPRQAELREQLLGAPRSREQLLEQGFRPELIRRMHQSGLIEASEQQPELRPEPGPALNDEQREAVVRLLAARRRFAAFVLAGVTGSGKTEVYLRAARALMGRRGQVLVIVPEIGLTPQLVRRFERRLGQRAWTYHSDLSEGERLACWQAARSGRARLIIGTRSAVFLPLKQAALIVVDEEHDSSLKQQDGARYHGRDVAVLRAQREQVPIVLGSATPALESLNNIDQGRYRLLRLRRRAGQAQEPRWRVLDQRGQTGPLSDALLGLIRKHLMAGGQVLLYRNRRGFAPVLMCKACGWSAECTRCSAHLTWHQVGERLQCHHCGAVQRPPRRCPECGDPGLVPLGAGTERLEALLNEQFPDTPVHRVDRDRLTGKHDFETLLETVRDGRPCILVGTQMLAKGHHLPGVTLAAVLDVDQGLFSADFRAPERLGQAIYQVAGRAGRADREGEFVLQTHHPEHLLLELLGRGDYLLFARQLLEERRAAALPPASGLALLRAESQQTEPARRFLRRAADILQGSGLNVSGPVPAIMTRRAGFWRYQLWVQSAERARLANVMAGQLSQLQALPEARRVRWHADMDPLDF
ncbi:primosomal protein N' [Wenzhouxiangella marina]|uniref:Replication restart protein PriA n=1 Tax=Wenzhouxiangella marina TaxID=1579979 RepID=A0A0K0XSM1_9GAMM|nr:primosomal protein N' [Wenzhouxiangella marina]AKS40626.1 Primosomal protein N [Wenzhouxiangella marina]MBB6088394.1 primosomal protein N' (replication factor Y) [Wenzhouxiangella marina]